MEINSDVVKDVIEEKSIYIEFQPIISAASKRIIGAEALSRGIYRGEIIHPFYLFHHAAACGKSLQLDRICHEKAMESFGSHQSAMLFINAGNEVLNMPESELDFIINRSVYYHIKTRNVVVEINERSVEDTEKLKAFADMCREKGLMICFDDVGADKNDFNRISAVKPDAVKIDRFIIQELEQSASARELLKSIVSLAKQAGAFTIAEGVETIQEVASCMVNGVDFFQGYYFANPMDIEMLNKIDLHQKLDDTYEYLNSSIKKRRAAEIRSKNSSIKLITGLSSELSLCEFKAFEDILWKFVYDNHHVECVYLLDDNGTQITDTIMLDELPNEERSLLFAPAVKGESHEIKNYYYAVHEGLEDPFVTDRYISAATGKPCKTLSSRFTDKKGNAVIVCVDLKDLKD